MHRSSVYWGICLWVAGVLLPAGTAYAIPATGLVSHWQAEGNALDSGPGGNDGTLKNGATFAPGKVGQGFLFDGVNDGVALGNPASLQLNSFTFGAWIQRGSLLVGGSAPNGEGEILTYGSGGYAFGFDTNSLNDQTFLSKTDVNIVASGPLTVTDLNFHYVAVTKNGAQVIFYVDGVAGAPIVYDPGFTFGSVVAIGARGDHLGPPAGTLVGSFAGIIDELAVWNRALSQNEIQGIIAEANVTGIPEPATLSLFAIGLIGLGAMRRRRTVAA